jgi:hypothetical protein
MIDFQEDKQAGFYFQYSNNDFRDRMLLYYQVDPTL